MDVNWRISGTIITAVQVLPPGPPGPSTLKTLDTPFTSHIGGGSVQSDSSGRVYFLGGSVTLGASQAEAVAIA